MPDSRLSFLRPVTLCLAYMVLAGCSAVYYRMGDSLSEVEDLLAYDTSESGKVYDTEGSLIGEYAIERSTSFTLDDLPTHVPQAFLAAEDKLFYNHDGVDLTSLAGAVIGNYARAQSGERLAGASTITMQVAKNLMLSNVDGIERKIAEIVQSLTLETITDKDRILEIYLADVFFGERTKGIAAAANVYFAKTPQELTIAEAATLAAMPKSPVQFNPYRFPDASKERRDWVIGQMLANEYISEAEAQDAVESPIVLKRGNFDRTIEHPYFTDEVRRSLDKVLGVGGFSQSGYRVEASLTPDLQILAEQTLRDGLVAYDRRYGWRGALGHISEFTGDVPATQETAPVGGGVNAERPAFASGGTKAFLPSIGGSDFPLGPEHVLAFEDIDPPAALHAWQLAMVTALDDSVAGIRLQDGTLGQISLSSLSWARPLGVNNARGRQPRDVSDILGLGDLIAVSPRDDEGAYDLQQIPLVNGGLVAMDPQTGRVLAISGGWDFGQSNFNRATQAQRQPGSTFKPIVYLAALEAGISPGAPVSDDRIKLALGRGEFFEPKNADEAYEYARPMFEGLERSRNMMTLHLIGKVGIRSVQDYAQLTHLNPQLRPEFAAALGTAETTVLRVATAYSTIANGGNFIRPRFVDRVTDRFGRVLFEDQEATCYQEACLDLRRFGKPRGLKNGETFAVADAKRVWQLTAMLRGVTERGTGARVGRQLPFDVAGKTGTTNDVKDAWFVGFTPSLVVAVYVGFDTPSSLGTGEQGSSIAAPIVGNFFAEVPEAFRTPFEAPEGIRGNTGVGRNGLIIAGGEGGLRIDGFGDRNLAQQLNNPNLEDGSEEGAPSRTTATRAASSGGFGGVF